MTTTGTTPGAARFITATTTIEAETGAAELTANAVELVPASTKGTGRQTGIPVNAVELVPAPTKGTGRQTGISAGAAEIPIVPAQRPGLLKETTKRLEDMLNPAVRAASARAPSAATTMAEKPGAIRHAEAPASAGEEERVVEAVAGIDNRSFVGFLIHREI
jgi:hypothetical protein